MWRLVRLVLISAIAVLVCSTQPGQATDRPTSYDLSLQAAFNQPSYYPIQQTPNPELYRPTADWLGRLILPDVGAEPRDRDWVWLEVYHAPTGAENLVGQRVRLEWSQQPGVQAYVDLVTTDVRLTEGAKRYQSWGNVIPSRLDGRDHVGPLRSLAGSRPQDDLIVRLDRVTLDTSSGQPVLQTLFEPVQVTGRFYGLVQILRPDPVESLAQANTATSTVTNTAASSESNTEAKSTAAESTTAESTTAENSDTQNAEVDVCSGVEACISEYFWVRHYNSATQQFDGAEERIRIPQQPRDGNGRFLSTSQLIDQSPAGTEGWYIYGAMDEAGVFTVQSLKPRSLFLLQPQAVMIDRKAGLNYIKRGNWDRTPERKGTVQSVLVTRQDMQDQDLDDAETAIADWQEGDQALVIHNFGGIGGENGEGAPGWTVTGHFAYGFGRVVRDPLSQDLVLDIIYQQIYAHNPNGIVSGSLDWTAYTGDLQRGWMGTRPISDVLVKSDLLTMPLRLGNTTLSLLDELLIQAQILAARYRTGDGTGVASVSPASSCVQDSSQALYIALQRLKQRALSTPELKTWLDEHPDDPNTERFYQLVALGEDLANALAPRGVVRQDWDGNAQRITGIDPDGNLNTEFTIENTIRSWRTMLPRTAYDEISSIFFANGATLWFLRTNQVGGLDPTIEPVAPTGVLGQLPVLSVVLDRLLDSSLAPLSWQSWLIWLAMLVAYAAIALPIGFQSGLFNVEIEQAAIASPIRTILAIVKRFFFPALVEELVFRIALIPHPSEVVTAITWMGWATLSLGLFVLYHPLLAITLLPVGRPLFFQAPFLINATVLGLACTATYRLTGSLWLTALLHWIIIVIWLFGLGGQYRLRPHWLNQPANSPISSSTKRVT
ncbi:MAG: CPBP family glutamic-type intramembrane protease [Thainema sp.]